MRILGATQETGPAGLPLWRGRTFCAKMTAGHEKARAQNRRRRPPFGPLPRAVFPAGRLGRGPAFRDRGRPAPLRPLHPARRRPFPDPRPALDFDETDFFGWSSAVPFSWPSVNVH